MFANTTKCTVRASEHDSDCIFYHKTKRKKAEQTFLIFNVCVIIMDETFLHLKGAMKGSVQILYTYIFVIVAFFICSLFFFAFFYPSLELRRGF